MLYVNVINKCYLLKKDCFFSMKLLEITIFEVVARNCITRYLNESQVNIFIKLIVFRIKDCLKHILRDG